jgi:hypothetical protein
VGRMMCGKNQGGAGVYACIIRAPQIVILSEATRIGSADVRREVERSLHWTSGIEKVVGLSQLEPLCP